MKTTKQIKKLITDTEQLATLNKISIKLYSKTSLRLDGDVSCGGYFDSHRRVFAVATKKAYDQWLPVYIHESCHMDQFLEDSKLWHSLTDGYTKFFDWLDGKIELSIHQLYKATQICIECELDCEKRAVQKIKDYNLPIDIEGYIRKANVYLYSYLYTQLSREWMKDSYNRESLYKASSTRFKSNYTTIPKKLLSEFQKVLPL